MAPRREDGAYASFKELALLDKLQFGVECVNVKIRMVKMAQYKTHLYRMVGSE
jgi:hypothetical protein